jgi:hypothetical protein
MALAACSSGTPIPPDTGPPFPQHVGGFDLAGPPKSGQAGTVAGYQMGGTEPQGDVIATVHRSPPGQSDGGGLVPFLDFGGGDPDAIATARLNRSIAEVRHFYRQAVVTQMGPAYLVQQGVLQRGRQATLQFTDSFAGTDQPIALDIVVLCCTAEGSSYEYRFRHAASVPMGAVETEFMSALPWTEGPKPPD